ncbi:acyltransferase [Egicoccus halophilus]|uniref:Putative acetyltransferase n=1 Tax=Egicoccus halophilus TaxID=1670830 RepID=A0A8J3EU02_9ACTN|nr:acyltransferase [Egicoccus halophilus]GGI06130.1 putative acetyltransferase [Egicoccus halophilus]
MPDDAADAAATPANAPVPDAAPPAHLGPDVPTSAADVEEAARAALHEHTEATVRAETAREGHRRASRLVADLLAERPLPDHVRRPPMRLHYPRWGWRQAVRHAVERRMLTPQYLRLYQRHAWHRARAAATGNHVVFQGVVFTGRRVEFRGRPGHGRLVLGPWCWIGDDNKLRAHEGQLTLGAKVVMGRDNVVNTYLDVEIGDASILADWIYVCDFDHRFDRLDVPIKDQGIVKSPVRIGGDVWVGEKATVLRGVDVGRGSVIASHCLVNVDIPPFSIAVGVPARVVKSRLPEGVDPEEAADRLRRGLPIPGDPIG